MLEIAVDSGDSGPLVRLSGECDLTTIGQLRGAFNAQIVSEAQHLTIDLSELRFADSATIRVFIETYREFKDAGRTLELLNPQPAIAQTIRLLGVDQVLAIRIKTGPGEQPTRP
jgi:anti-anti-sigma factor